MEPKVTYVDRLPTYKWDMFINDEWKAGGECSEIGEADAEAARYAVQYADEWRNGKAEIIITKMFTVVSIQFGPYNDEAQP